MCCFKVSHVLSCLGDRQRERKDGETGEVWEGTGQKVQRLIILGLLRLAACPQLSGSCSRFYRAVSKHQLRAGYQGS